MTMPSIVKIARNFAAQIDWKASLILSRITAYSLREVKSQKTKGKS
jgi:hypothetical protein